MVFVFYPELQMSKTMERKCVLSLCLERLKISLLLFIMISRACYSIAPMTHESGSRRHLSGAPDSSAAPESGGFDVGGSVQSRRADSRQIRWAMSAYEYVLGVDCQRNAFSTEGECTEVQRIERSRWNVYLADPQLPPSPSRDRRRRYLRTMLPDGPLGDVGRHHRVDGVVALDPYPDANFGHLIIVFHVTVAASASWCRRRDGFLIGSFSFCTYFMFLCVCLLLPGVTEDDDDNNPTDQ